MGMEFSEVGEGVLGLGAGSLVGSPGDVGEEGAETKIQPTKRE
jgi:hypothetical protein